MHDETAGLIRIERDGPTRILIMEYERLNTIVHGIRRALADALLEAELDLETHSVVLMGAGGNFCGGADLDEFARGTAMSPPSLHGHIIPFIEAMSKPVVAVVEGFALGGGLELALGCHARVADHRARVGLPETNFGLIPGAGGTVRLPRAVGAETAARMIVAAEVVRARDLAGTGLFDLVTEGDARKAGIEFARDLAARSGKLPRLRDLPVAAFDAEALDALETLTRPSSRATRLALDCVRRATTDQVDRALAVEYADFIGLLFGEESAALRHLFQSERGTRKIAGLPPGTRPATIHRIGIVGSGAFATTIARAGAEAGFEMVVDESEIRLAEGPESGGVENPESAPPPANCDLVLEAVDGSSGTRPTGVAGRVQLHALGGAADARVVEVARICETTPEDLMAAMQFVHRLGRLPVCVRTDSGFPVTRLLLRYLDQALAFAASGVPPLRIDRALEVFGMGTGPFETMDKIGLDVLLRERGSGSSPGWDIVRTFVAEGRRGQKDGAGWYDWDAQERRTGENIPATLLPPPAVDMPDDETIAHRCVLALVNEGARVLEDGTVQRAGDIDIAMVESCGFPATKGGPLFWAKTRGLPLTLVDITRLSKTTGDVFWKPAPAIRKGTFGH